MSTPCNEAGTSTTRKFYLRSMNVTNKSISYAIGDANIQTPSALQGELRTFKDELHTIIDSYRNIYGQFPWSELAKRYNDGDVTVLPEIVKLRQTIDVKVKLMVFDNFVETFTKILSQNSLNFNSNLLK